MSLYACVCKNTIVIWPLLLATTKLGQGNIFTCVCDSVNRGVTWHTHTQPPPGTPPRPGTPSGTRYPPDQVHPRDQVHPPRTRSTPQDQVHSPGIRTTSGQYASYWNAFLFIELIAGFCVKITRGKHREFHFG